MTHRSRVLPRVAWVVLCLGLIGYWVSIGKYYADQTPANTTNLQVQNSQWSGASLHPSRIGVGDDDDQFYVSTQDLRDAIDGDEDALARVVEKISEASEQNREPDDFWGFIERVQFVWYEPYGTLEFSWNYNFGRSLLYFGEDIMLQDIRDHESIGRDANHWDWDEGGWSFWPSFGHEVISHDGAVKRSWRVGILGIFQVISACLVGAWLVGLVIGLLRVSKSIRSRVRYGVFFVLFMSACVVSLIEMQNASYEIGNSHDVALSGAFTIGYLDRVLADETKLLVFCKDLLDLIPEGQEGDLLLAQAWNYVPESYQGDVYSRRYVSIWIGQFYVWAWFNQYTFEHVEEAQEIQVWSGGSWWEQLIQFGVFELSWGPIEKQSSLSFGIFGWISIGVLFWMLWKMTHWVARLVFGRIQKRRVRREQCIFCAYPLSDEAKKARSLGIGS